MIIFFIAAQLFINYKRGTVCSPFFHYGMYSDVIKPASNYIIPEVYVNGERLAVKDFSPSQWDNIMQPLIRFNDQQKWNSMLWHNDIRRIMPFTDSLKFVNNISKETFKNWYTQQLENITSKKVNELNIFFTDYTFNGISFIMQTKHSF